MIGWLAAAALGADAELHGDVKSFFVASFPYPWFVAPDLGVPELQEQVDAFVAPLSDPSGQGVADLRLKGTLTVGDAWRFEVHHAVSTLHVPSSGSPLGAGSGVALTAPELIDLTWQPDTGAGMVIRGRTDRLTARLSVPNLDLTVGRQPVTFGSGLVFTPMDVVNPFSAATIDTEYKPGIDAVRMDGYLGTSGRMTGVVAWSGATPIHDPGRSDVTAEDVILALNGQGTVGVTDLPGLVGAVRGEAVFGAGVVSAIGPVGVHGDATLTLPSGDEDPFVRAVVGADWRPTGTTTLSSEAYYQGFGAADPEGYWDVLQGPRFARGEVWQAGRTYASLAWAQEITPLVSGSLAVIGNLADPSALVAPGLSWSVSDEAAMSLGGFVGVGERPEATELMLDPATFALVPPSDEALASSIRSEFGLYPAALYLRLAAYF